MPNLSLEDILKATARLTQEAGMAAPIDLKPLAGGKNNRVFHVSLKDGTELVLKSYFYDPRDPRDRLGAEWDFISYAWAHDVRNTPQPIAHNSELHLGLYSFVSGRKIAPAELTLSHIRAAAEFIIKLNSAPREPMLLAPGSEACFTFHQHLETVERRIRRLAELSPAPSDRALVSDFVNFRLLPAWHIVETRLNNSLSEGGVASSEPITLSDIMISPSDFGFHNALFDDATGRIHFIDFEYAGRDDPAKMIADFFCQPEIPVGMEYFEFFVDLVLTGLGLGKAHRERCLLLLDLYRIKWAAIILNRFMPVGAARRSFAEYSTGGEPAACQIARAEAQLANIST